MYWSWNSSYVFLKLEVSSTAVPKTVNANQAFAVHLGGYAGDGSTRTVNNLRRVSLPITTQAIVRQDVASQIHLFVVALQVFNGPDKISLATTNGVHTPATATPIADNYQNMFQVDHVHNILH